MKNNALIYCSAGLLALLIIVYPVLAIADADLTAYAGFAGPIVAILVTGLGLSNKVESVHQTAQKVERQTNGELKAQFDEVKTLIVETNGANGNTADKATAPQGSHPYIPGMNP